MAGVKPFTQSLEITCNRSPTHVPPPPSSVALNLVSSRKHLNDLLVLSILEFCAKGIEMWIPRWSEAELDPFV